MPVSREVLIVQTLYRSVALIASSLRPLTSKQIRESVGCTSNAIWSMVAELLAQHPNTVAVGTRRWRVYEFRG